MPKPRRKIDDCMAALREAVGTDTLSNKEAEKIINAIADKAQARADKKGISIEEALTEIEGEIIPEADLLDKILQRNKLLSLSSKRKVLHIVRKFPTSGLGLRAFLEGSERKLGGARLSVDARIDALHGKYSGRLISELKQEGLFKDFTGSTMDKDIWLEMGARGTDQVGRTGNKKAARIAELIDTLYDEIISHQNSVGAYIKRLPGYIIRQTHDRIALRGLGKTKEEAFDVWFEDTLPLLDLEKTFDTKDPGTVKARLRKIFNSLYSGHHGAPDNPAEIHGFTATMNLAKKASASRVLHFKDAEAAYNYNQLFGLRKMSDSVFSDLFFRSRNIVLMESFGPNPEETFNAIVRQLKDEARDLGDAKEIDSLNDRRVQGAFDQVTGKFDHPENLTIAKLGAGARAISLMAKMGGVVLSSLGDKAFLQAEMAFQGIDQLDTLGKQITGMAERSPEGQKMLSMMGVALDGIHGNTLSRFAIHDTIASGIHKTQQKFFDWNFMNWWNDRMKASAGELMSHHLGDLADTGWKAMDERTRSALELYNIDETDWDAMRAHVYKNEEGTAYLVPDEFEKIPDAVIDKMLQRDNLKLTDANRKRARRELDLKYRTYLSDRVNHAVPTPGASEKKLAVLGTQAGTPLGEAVRMFTLFKMFPITVFGKILGRDFFNDAAVSAAPDPWSAAKAFLQSNHQGKIRIAQLVAMTTIGGYLSGVVKDALKGKTPKALVSDGKINTDVLTDAAMRGGGLGIFGDLLFQEYDKSYNNALSIFAGPIGGQIPDVFDAFQKGKDAAFGDGEFPGREIEKLTRDNIPGINLFYIRPILNYLVLWNLQEMMDPGSLKRTEDSVRKYSHQDYFIEPSESYLGK